MPARPSPLPAPDEVRRVPPETAERMREVLTPTGQRILLLDDDDDNDALAAAPVAPPAADGSARRPRPAELRSEELEEIVGEIPGGILRWGISIVFLAVVVLAALAFVVRYPEVVRGQAVLTNASPPVRVVAPSSGEIAELRVEEGLQVAPGDYLAILRNRADPAAIAAVVEMMDAFESSLREGTPGDPGFAPVPGLGDVQAPYTGFLLALSEHDAFAADPYFASKAATLRDQDAGQRSLRATLEDNLRLAERELALGERNRERSRALGERGLLAPAEVEEAETEYLRRAQAVSAARSALTANQAQVSALAGTLLDLERERRELQMRARLSLVSAFDGLRDAVREWEQAYVLRASVAGRVTFFRPLAEGQFLNAAEPVLAVVPEGPPTAASITLPHAAAGRVRPGQRVLLRFDAYPAAEFGTVEGRVRSVSRIADRIRTERDPHPQLLVGVGLPDRLVTSFGRELTPLHELQGTADVVTDDLRVIDRILHRFRSAASAAVAADAPEPAPAAP